MKKGNALLLGILLLAFVIRLPHLMDKERGTDEKLTLETAEFMRDSFVSWNSFKEVVVNYPYYARAEVNPPLFPLLLGIILALSDSLLVLKLSLVVFGLLSILFLFVFARRIFGEKVACYAAFLYAVNPLHVIFSQHLRSYVFLFVLFNISLVLLYSYCKKPEGRVLAYLGVVFVLAVYTHYFALLFVGAGIVTLFVWNILKKRKVRPLVFLGVLLVVALLPVAWILKEQLGLYAIGEKELVTLLILPYPIYKFSVGADVSTVIENFPYIFLLFPLVIGLVVYGFVTLVRKRHEDALFLGLNFVLPYSVLALVGIFITVYSFRYLMFLLSVWVLLLGYGLVHVGEKVRLGSISLIVLGWSIILVYYYSIVTVYHWPFHIAI